MGRVQFYHTMWREHPVTGVVEALDDFAATVFEVEENGAEGSSAVVFANRTGVTQPSTMDTNSQGEIAFWLDPGDYNVHLEDNQTPARAATKVLGVSSVPGGYGDILMSQLPDGGAMLPKVGDYKLSAIEGDDGDDWLLCDGRTITSASHADLWAALGTEYNTGGEAAGQRRIPDARGRFLLVPDNMQSGRGNANRLPATSSLLGATGGTEVHQHGYTTPSHKHDVTVTAHQHTVPDHLHHPGSLYTGGHSHGVSVSGWTSSGVGANSGTAAASPGADPYALFRHVHTFSGGGATGAVGNLGIGGMTGASDRDLTSGPAGAATVRSGTPVEDAGSALTTNVSNIPNYIAANLLIKT